jgi:hypothetical protein
MFPARHSLANSEKHPSEQSFFGLSLNGDDKNYINVKKVPGTTAT